MKKIYLGLIASLAIAISMPSCSVFKKSSVVAISEDEVVEVAQRPAAASAKPSKPSKKDRNKGKDKTTETATPAAPVNAPINRTPEGSDAVAALNGEWNILDVNGIAVEQPVIEEDGITITLELKPNGAGALYCYTGCNYINGDVTFAPAGDVTVNGSYLKTMMACSPEAEKLENAITNSLNNIAKYKVEHLDAAYFLYLNDAAGRTLLTSRRWDNNFMNGAWQVVSINETPVANNAGLSLVFDVDGERIHGNTGCNILNGTLVLTSDRINGMEFNDIAITMRGCPDDQQMLEKSLLLALEEVASCQALSHGNEAVLKDSAGQPIIRLKRINISK